MRIAFTKMHGVGNDFVIFDAPPDSLLEPASLRTLADRRTGIGFDQALVLEAPRRAGTAVFYRIFNSDGDEVEQCGNGARCIAALLHRRGAARDGRVTLGSPAGVVEARINGAVNVSVDMGVPDFDPRSLPFDAPAEADTYPLEVEGRTVAIGAVSLGNPHAVLVVPSVETAPVGTLGPAIERHARFPRRVNAGFLEIVDRAHLRLRVYERGAGETLACGTGACAAAAVARRRGLIDAAVRVEVRGGELRVNWEGRGAHIWLSGPAEVSFEGHVEVLTAEVRNHDDKRSPGTYRSRVGGGGDRWLPAAQSRFLRAPSGGARPPQAPARARRRRHLARRAPDRGAAREAPRHRGQARRAGAHRARQRCDRRPAAPLHAAAAAGGAAPGSDRAHRGGAARGFRRVPFGAGTDRRARRSPRAALRAHRGAGRSESQILREPVRERQAALRPGARLAARVPVRSRGAGDGFGGAGAARRQGLDRPAGARQRRPRPLPPRHEHRIPRPHG